MRSTRADDTVQLNQIREGRPGAFEQLYQHFAPVLISFLRHKVDNPAVAEELMQETFIRLLSASRFEPNQASLSSFLHIIAKNLSLTWLRNTRLRPEQLLDIYQAPHLEPMWQQAEELPEARLEREAIQLEVRNALRQLPLHQRQAFLLRHAADWSYEQIASEVGCPVGTAKSRVHLARQALKEALEPSAPAVDPVASMRIFP